MCMGPSMNHVNIFLLLFIIFETVSDNIFHEKIIQYVHGHKSRTVGSILSKTTLTTGGVGGAGVDSPPRKTDTFFLGSLALSVSIYRHFQSNGAKLRSPKY